MFSKIRKLYFPLFYTLILFNVFISVFPLALFWKFGFNAPPIYFLALFIKLIGYALSILAEKWLNANRSFFFRNLGLSYRHLFLWLFSIDLLYLLFFLLICWIIQVYI